MKATETYKGILITVDTFNEEVDFIQPDKLRPKLPITYWRYPPAIGQGVPGQLSFNAQWNQDRPSPPGTSQEDFNYWCTARDTWLAKMLLNQAHIIIDTHIPGARCLYCGGPLVCLEDSYYNIDINGFFDVDDREVEDHTIVCAYNHKHKCGNWELEIDEDGIGHIRLTK